MAERSPLSSEGDCHDEGIRMAEGSPKALSSEGDCREDNHRWLPAGGHYEGCHSEYIVGGGIKYIGRD